MGISAWLSIAVVSSLVACAVGAGVWIYTPYWDRVALWQLGELTPRFERLGLDAEKMRFYLRLWGIGVIVVFCLFAFLLEMPPVAFVLALLALVAPRHILDWMIRRRPRILRDQLVAASIGLGNAAKAGLSLAQGLESVCAETPPPLSGELQRIVFEFRCGRPLKDAIEQVRQRLDLEAFTLFALAVEAAMDRGGAINTALERISASLVENQRLERKLDSETSAGRQVVLLLSLFPIGFIGLFYLLNPESTILLFRTLAGQIVLVAVIGLIYAGARWAQRIMRIEV